MTVDFKGRIAFVRLTEVPANDILAHMTDPRVGEHMPLLTQKWDLETVKKFIECKEGYWKSDGLGHWAILHNGEYAGWGGFQKEGDDWDFGLVLSTKYFGIGQSVFLEAIKFARADGRIGSVTFLLPPSRRSFGALDRIGAKFSGQVKYQGNIFKKYRLAI